MGGFIHTGAKRHCICPKQLERYSNIYEGLATRGVSTRKYEDHLIFLSSKKFYNEANRVVKKSNRGSGISGKAYPKVSQLPHTSHNQHHDLCHAIPHRSRIRGLAHIPEIRLPLPLILLLPPDILKFDVQLSNLGSDF